MAEEAKEADVQVDTPRYPIGLETFLHVLIIASTKEEQDADQTDYVVNQFEQSKINPTVLYGPTYKEIISSVEEATKQDSIPGILIMILEFGDMESKPHHIVIGDILGLLNCTALHGKPKVVFAQSCQPPASAEGFHFELRERDILVVTSKKGPKEGHFLLKTFTKVLFSEENAGKDIQDICALVSREMESEKAAEAKASDSSDIGIALESRSSLSKALILIPSGDKTPTEETLQDSSYMSYCGIL